MTPDIEKLIEALRARAASRLALVPEKELATKAADALASLVREREIARDALTEISSPTQSLNLLWWQIRAREALAALSSERERGAVSGKLPSWAAPKNAAHPTGSTGTCFNCGLRFSSARPYGGIDEADGVPMCEQCWDAYGMHQPISRTIGRMFRHPLGRFALGAVIVLIFAGLYWLSKAMGWVG